METSVGELLPFFTGFRVLAPAPSKKGQAPFYKFILAAQALAPSQKVRDPALQLLAPQLLYRLRLPLNRFNGLAAYKFLSGYFSPTLLDTLYSIMYKAFRDLQKTFSFLKVIHHNAIKIIRIEKQIQLIDLVFLFPRFLSLLKLNYICSK